MVATSLRLTPTGLLLLASLVACHPEVTVVRESSDQVMLRWYHWHSDIVEAENIADAHCKSHGRSAELEQESVDQDVTLAQFACR
jgi:hypothetical protein